jgi:integrase
VAGSSTGWRTSSAPQFGSRLLRATERAVYRHLTPGLGNHRLIRLEAEHIEKLYAKMAASGLKPGTVHQAHRTLRTALNEAVRRGHIIKNPTELAKAPRLADEEIEPFTVDEARRVLATAERQRNGARWVVALSLGLRKGEALGLQWPDLDLDTGTLRIKRAQQRYPWRHGCGGSCSQKRARDCPSRTGGLVVVETKSRAGRRGIGLPDPVVDLLRRHREAQDVEREKAADLWGEGGWVFCQPNGRPINPRTDHNHWKALLQEAGVRNARLHDARHTAATMLLLLGVPDRAVMALMGWSNASMTARYQHLTGPVRHDIAQRVGALYWTEVPNAPVSGE